MNDLRCSRCESVTDVAEYTCPPALTICLCRECVKQNVKGINYT